MLEAHPSEGEEPSECTCLLPKPPPSRVQISPLFTARQSRPYRRHNRHRTQDGDCTGPHYKSPTRGAPHAPRLRKCNKPYRGGLQLTNPQQLPKSDLKNARLINKKWSAVAALDLWSRFTIDLASTDDRTLNPLVISYPNGFLDSINILKITTKGQKYLSQQLEREAMSNVLLLLGALPRDTLTSFQAAQYRLSQSTAGLLLRTQSRLTFLSLCMDEDDQNGLPGSCFVRGNLQNLHKLQIWVVGGWQNTYKGYSEWFPHAPALRDLCVHGRLPINNHFSGWTLPLGASPIKLRSVYLSKLDLSSFAIDDATSLLDLSYLATLTIKDCTGGEPVLRSLAKGYRRAGRSSLKHFTYTCPQVTNAVCNASEELFESVDTLVDLTLGYATDRIPDLRSLQRTGKYLNWLDTYAVDDERVYSASDVEHLDSCTCLKSVRLSLGDLSPAIDNLDRFESCSLSAFEGFEDRLVSSTILEDCGIDPKTPLRLCLRNTRPLASWSSQAAPLCRTIAAPVSVDGDTCS